MVRKQCHNNNNKGENSQNVKEEQATVHITDHCWSVVSMQQCLAAEKLEPFLKSLSVCLYISSHFLFASVVATVIIVVNCSTVSLFSKAASPRLASFIATWKGIWLSGYAWKLLILSIVSCKDNILDKPILFDGACDWKLNQLSLIKVFLVQSLIVPAFIVNQ